MYLQRVLWAPVNVEEQVKSSFLHPTYITYLHTRLRYKSTGSVAKLSWTRIEEGVSSTVQCHLNSIALRGLRR